MPRGPKGHRRPAEVIGNAVMALMDRPAAYRKRSRQISN